uniref:6-phosphogluconate dehydrogenase NADP-binding domain-containing protein n=2 Tax=Attheya septentrionalis TaxID=420275 RepID=A0A7S2U5R2_9STRA|mmetsp:Transcript_11690/g.21265  ORF Transcript_11690/g.21265 Transcript_11690/m.21265 type:complete len:378 (+) Transcript_11690:251-1384(+)
MMGSDSSQRGGCGWSRRLIVLFLTMVATTLQVHAWIPSTKLVHSRSLGLGTNGYRSSCLKLDSSKRSALKMSSNIGFVGLGIMGEGMAARLLSEGIAGQSAEAPLVVWNRTGSKCDALKEKFPDKFVEIKATAKEVVEACGVTYSILSTPEASRAVFEGEDGVLAGVSDGKSIVDCATLAESDMKRMNDAVVAKGGRFLEAPVSGSKAPAHMGALIFLCAGSQDLFNEIVNNGLNAMGKASHFFNTEVGYGTRAKLVVNSLMGTMMAAFGEGLALAEAVGLDGTKMVEVIGQGAIQSPVYSLKGPKMLKGDHAPNFPLKHAHKDMALASDMAKAAGVEYSVMDQAEAIFRQAREDSELNLADEDFSAVFEEIKKKSA